MNGLIEALKLLQSYADPAYPTHCEHDVLYVNVDPELVSDEDKKRLEELGFTPNLEFSMFQSFRYGSC